MIQLTEQEHAELLAKAARLDSIIEALPTAGEPVLQTTGAMLLEMAEAIKSASSGASLMLAYGLMGQNAVKLVNDAHAAHVLKAERDEAIRRGDELMAAMAIALNAARAALVQCGREGGPACQQIDTALASAGGAA